MKTTDEMILKVIEGAKSNLKNSTELMPTFFVGAGEKISIVGAPFSTEREKDVIADGIRAMAEELQADFVVFLSETWTLSPEDGKDFMENRHKYRSVSEHPRKKEAVTLMLETRFEVKMGMAEILPGREMGEIKWITPDSATGRFTNLLPKTPIH
jgi:hypothetical protein